MRIVVSDTSCMIDLRKARLLEALLQLPYQFVMPNTLFDDEWLSLTQREKRLLLNQGLEVRDLPGEQVVRATRYFNQHRRLTLNDCFALTLAEDIEDAILMTGERDLRRVARGKGIEVRGVLWATDEMEAHDIVAPRMLFHALTLFQEDGSVFLPPHEISSRLRRLRRYL